MISYILSFSWGICILLSLIGWGGIINRVLFFKQPIDWGQKAAWGVAFSILMGGILNVTWSISKTTVLIYLGLGLLYWLFELYQSRNVFIPWLKNFICNSREDPFFFIGVMVICLLIFGEYAAWVSTNAFNGDDYLGYFVFPNKMLQLGSMGPDPFSERRMTSLGGQSFLHTFVLALLSEKNLYIIDPGIATIIVVGLLLGFFRQKGLSKRTTIFIIVFFLLTPAPRVNVTSLIIALSLFLSLFRTLEGEELKSNHFALNALIIALTTASICSLKSNFIPACVIIIFLSYFLYITKTENKKKAIYEFGTTITFIIIFLMPWMISMSQSSGTFLFPLLGKGYHGSAYGINYSTYYDSSSSFHRVIKSFNILISWNLRVYFASIFLFVLISFRLQKNTERNAYLPLVVSVILSTFLIAFVLQSKSYLDFYRYTFSFTFALLIISIATALSNPRGERKKFANTTSKLGAMFLVGVLTGNMWHTSEKEFGIWRKNIGFGRRDISLEEVSGQEIYRYHKIQQLIPEKATILTRLDAAFLLDFRRNVIFIADWPGSASPPPGIPVFRGADTLADYLIAQSIRYVAYSYSKKSQLPNFYLREFLAKHKPDDYPWLIKELNLTLDFQENLERLSKTRKIIFNDSEIMVLDLLAENYKKED